ncbi:MAG: hypothetical protein JXJ04_15780 [Spirochaetales bacterium]|nr:hypothetical protein [Spirochaetales bacterium]
MKTKMICVLWISLCSALFLQADPLHDILSENGYQSIKIQETEKRVTVSCELPDSSHEGSIHAGIVFALASAALEYHDSESISLVTLVESIPVITFDVKTPVILDLLNNTITGETFLKKLTVRLPEDAYGKQNASYTKVFSETFDADSTWFVDNASFFIKNGKYCVYPRDMDRYSFNKDITLENGKIEVDAKWTGGLDGFGYGILFGRADSNHYYYCLLAGSGYYVLGYIDGKTSNKLKNWTQSALIKPRGENHLSVIIHDGTITLLVNKEQLFQITDNHFKGGTCGVYVSKDVQVEFDNFTVYRE